MWAAVCGQQYVDSSLWTAVCGQQYVDSSTWTAVCGQQYVNSSMWAAVHRQQYLDSSMGTAVCGQVDSSMWTAICGLAVLQSTLVIRASTCYPELPPVVSAFTATHIRANASRRLPALTRRLSPPSSSLPEISLLP
nr:hypothetical protein BgiMline_017823 [Biomphalaria glabrata]